MTSVGGYEILEQIGQSGMGTVYRAKAPDGASVAVKTLHLQLSGINEFVARFHWEAQLARKLAHPNVVRVLDDGEADGQHYLVMEYVAGRSFTEQMHEAGIHTAEMKFSSSGQDAAASGVAPGASLPVEQVIKWLRQIAGVLQAAEKVNPDIPRNLNWVLDRLLVKKAEARPQTPAELIEDLNRVERGEPPLTRYRSKRMLKHKTWHTVAMMLLVAGLFGAWSHFSGANASTVIAEQGSKGTGPTVVNVAGMAFVWIPQLKMCVGKYEVTNGEYRKFKPKHSSGSYKGHSLDRDRQPVGSVNWDDACAYATWLTARERASGRLPAGLRYRLPTEQEWLTFAQCGDRRKYPWGDNWPPKSGEETISFGYYDDVIISGYRHGSEVSCDVEKCWANPWGLCGVGGNVWECCARDTNSKQSFGAWRGASWSTDDEYCLRCEYRFVYSAFYRGLDGGFRLVLSR